MSLFDRSFPENIHTPPTEGIGISWGGGGFRKTKKIKEMHEAQLEFPEGLGGGVLKKIPFRGGGMDIFWNYTFSNYSSCCIAL